MEYIKQPTTEFLTGEGRQIRDEEDLIELAAESENEEFDELDFSEGGNGEVY